jgi:two-component system OmpR family response regulator
MQFVIDDLVWGGWVLAGLSVDKPKSRNSKETMKYLPHILVVDDDSGVCEVIRNLLEDNKFRVSIADGGAAMRRIMADDAPDLVILDAALPGESGESLARHADGSGIKVIMMTGHPSLSQPLADGSLPFILKPFHIADMLTLVIETLQRAAG